jgi:uncharacterized protein YjbI with pentapeptide repeats
MGYAIVNSGDTITNIDDEAAVFKSRFINVIFSASLSNAEFHYCEFIGCTFTDEFSAEASEFYECTFNDCTWTDCTISNSKFAECGFNKNKFDNCKFSWCKFDAIGVKSTEFYRCVFDSVGFNEFTSNGSSSFNRSEFGSCDLLGLDYSTPLKNCVFGETIRGNGTTIISFVLGAYSVTMTHDMVNIGCTNLPIIEWLLRDNTKTSLQNFYANKYGDVLIMLHNAHFSNND